jgi:O-acetyl-ADP-ribose deacetylase (regulator of RNase III)
MEADIFELLTENSWLEAKKLEAKTDCIIFESNPRRTNSKVLAVASIRSGDVKLEVMKGDILDSTVDVIVNSANSQLSHGAGVARAIADRANGSGNSFTLASEQVVRVSSIPTFRNLIRQSLLLCQDTKERSIPEGAAVWTSACELEGSFPGGVIHCVPPMFGSAQSTARNEGLIFDCVMHCLEIANENDSTSIAFPILGCGIFNNPLHVSCQAMFKAIRVLLLLIILAIYYLSYLNRT